MHGAPLVIWVNEGRASHHVKTNASLFVETIQTFKPTFAVSVLLFNVCVN